MSHSHALLHFSPAGRHAPTPVREFADRSEYEVLELENADVVLASVSRAYPAAVVLDGCPPAAESLALCRQLKRETFTAVVPVVMYVAADGAREDAAAALEAGADEVLTPSLSEREYDLRLALALRRAERDVSVHPTTRLPGTVQIERDLNERLRNGQKFAFCYADLDHFKEFNDRYGYHSGDRVILIVSRVLRDVVRAHAPGGFVGHIGGDDFTFSIPLEHLDACCTDVITVFDELLPLHYTDEDRQRGWYVGKDRRGNEYDVPLMTLSIGVVTNRIRTLAHPAQVSELAAEMKTYAKSFPGSVYKVDRRTDNKPWPPPAVAP